MVEELGKASGGAGKFTSTGDDRLEGLQAANIDDLSEEDMNALIDDSFSQHARGEIVKGVVIKVNPEDIVVDIGSKSEGAIRKGDFYLPGEPEEARVGQEIQVYVMAAEDSEGHPRLSRRRAMELVARQEVKDAFTEGRPVKCRVIEIMDKGGLRVSMNGMLGFIPFSQTGVRSRNREDLEPMLGQEIEAKVLELRGKRDVVLSRRAFLEELLSKQKTETMENLAPGRVVKGVVKNLTDFGAFIDLGGVDGLLHIQDMAWRHVERPSDIVQVGQTVDVMVLGVNGDRISLGKKQLTQDPWDGVAERFPNGAVHTGRVTSLTKYGAFVEMEPGVEGLIHISEISWTRRLRHPSEVLKEGETVQVRVLDVDAEKKRISLSYKQTETDPWTLAAASTPEGSFFDGEVTGLTDFGAFVRLPCGVDGMIHVSDLSWTRRVRKPSEMLKKGDHVKVKVLEINPAEQRIALGLKQAEQDPWEMVPVKYPAGTIVEVTVTKLADFGAFCELEEGIEGLVHISELSENKVGQVGDVLKAGDKVRMKVVKIDAHQRRIGLSIKALERSTPSRDEEDRYMAAPDAPLASLGELLAPLMESARAQKKAQEEAEGRGA